MPKEKLNQESESENLEGLPDPEAIVRRIDDERVSFENGVFVIHNYAGEVLQKIAPTESIEIKGPLGVGSISLEDHILDILGKEDQDLAA